MPIVSIELVDDVQPTPVSGEQVAELANRLGECFGTAPGRTWVKLRTLPRGRYAENGVADLSAVRPTFVSVLKATLPSDEELEAEARAVCNAVAQVLQRPPENTHVLFEPPAAGRIAFGGQLVRRPG